VRIIYDHRVVDGATVARALLDLEKVLNQEIVAELQHTREVKLLKLTTRMPSAPDTAGMSTVRRVFGALYLQAWRAEDGQGRTRGRKESLVVSLASSRQLRGYWLEHELAGRKKSPAVGSFGVAQSPKLPLSRTVSIITTSKRIAI
jgi:hypothetical protein